MTAAAILLLGREEWGADPSLPRLGRAVDRAIAENYMQKTETHTDLPGAGVAALFSEA